MPEKEELGNNIPKVYDPQSFEKKWYEFWEKNKFFHAEVDKSKKPYSMVIPPPNVTGQLHMGHALDNTLQDILIRYHRMQGYNTVWIPGCDHAGIATQAKVEGALRKEGTNRYELGREKFLERVWDWKEKFGSRIMFQLRSLGSSLDWDRERFTMDEGCSRAVREVFVSLYEKGLIYQGTRITNWCPSCNTAISDIEVEHETEQGHLWHLRYEVEGEPGKYVEIATTRPETMFGDTGVAVHPDDERYKDLVGKTLILPIVGRRIPLFADEYVDKNFGTGAVKVTPDHPVLVDRYMQGTEVEVDGISDGVDVVIPGIMEHVERAGVHSGDSIAVYPPQTLSSKVIYTIIDYTKRLALSLHVKGLLNIQFVVVDGEVYIIEVNPRSSRTVPFLSKVTNVDMVGIATRIAMGHTLKELGYKSGLVPPKPYVAVKAPVFSFAKMTDVDIALGPEMKSTGEVMGIDYHYARALYKAIIGSGIHVPTKGCILFTVADKDKEEMKQLAKAFSELGFEICATEGTAKAIQSMGIDAEIVGKVHERSSDIIQMIKNGKINMVINTLTQGKHSAKDGFKIRRATVEHGIACLTSLDTAWEVLRVLSFMRERRLVYSLAIQDYVGGGDDLA